MLYSRINKQKMKVEVHLEFVRDDFALQRITNILAEAKRLAQENTQGKSKNLHDTEDTDKCSYPILLGGGQTDEKGNCPKSRKKFKNQALFSA